MRYLLLSLIVICTTGCNIRLVMSDVQQHAAVAVHEPFAIIGANETLDTAGLRLVAHVRTQDGGLTMRCDYETVLDTVVGMARAMGANLVKVDDHLPPTTFSTTCHRLTASLYRSDDVRRFEERILWYPERHLQVADLRGDTLHRPFQAATACGISYRSDVVRGRTNISVEAFVDPRMSYFKHSADDAFVLRHEQLHFDIAEVYARTLRKQILETPLSRADLPRVLAELHDKVIQELALEQDRYDAEVYADPVKQTFWSDVVALRLTTLDRYKEHRIAPKFK